MRFASAVARSASPARRTHDPVAGTRAVLVARRRAPDDGRRPGRRLPLRRAGLEPRRRDRRPLVRAPRHAAADLRGRDARRRPTSLAARAVAEHLGTDHHERTYTAEEALDALPDVVRSIESFDPGLVRSAVPNYMLARDDREHVKVVLTGEGADELFAGYAYMAEIDGPEELHAELERTVALAAQPQPPALRPGDDGPRPRGARPVPGPRGHPLGAAACPAEAKLDAPGPARRRRSCARPSTAGCPTTCCGA